MDWNSGVNWNPPFTLEGWIYPTAGSKGIWAGGDSSEGFGLHLSGSTSLEVTKCVSSLCNSDSSAVVGSLLNRWTYFALVADEDETGTVALEILLGRPRL